MTTEEKDEHKVEHQGQKEWHEEIVEQLEYQAIRSQAFIKPFLKFIPFSFVLGIVVAGTVVHYWGWREFSRMLLQVFLTLTLGTAVFGTVIKRIEKKLEE